MLECYTKQAELMVQHLDGAEGLPCRQVSSERTGALLEKISRRPIARPTGPGPIPSPEQKETSKRQRPRSL